MGYFGTYETVIQGGASEDGNKRGYIVPGLRAQITHTALRHAFGVDGNPAGAFSVPVRVTVQRGRIVVEALGAAKEGR